jgi:carbon monoxide dehydrogenase subunit G
MTMPKINFELPVPVDPKKAFEKMKTFLSSDNDFKKFDPKVTCTFDEAKQSCSIKGSQFTATITAIEIKKSEENKTNVEVQIDIPFALVLFKGKIQEIVEKNIKKVFKV